jgi:hypothetical protein
MNVRMYESCSCKMVCRCTLGPAEPDQGWCSGAIGVAVIDGESEGVVLTGAKVLLHAELPGDFLGGIDKAKMYLDAALSDAQRAELDAIFHGERGGVWAGMREAIATWLPSQVADITLEDGDTPRFTVAGVGANTLEALKTESGDRAVLRNAPIAAAFGQTDLELATATGSRWADPDLRPWESLGYGAVSVAQWAG